MATIDLVRMIRRKGADVSWYIAMLDELWLNEHEQTRDAAGNRQRVTRTRFASSAVARRAYHAAIRAREDEGFVEHYPISTPSWAINGKGQRAYWYVGKSKSWFGKGNKWGADVEVVVNDTTAKPAAKPPAQKPNKPKAARPAAKPKRSVSRRRRS